MFCLFVPNCFVSFFHFSEVGMYVEDLKRFSGALASLSWDWNENQALFQLYWGAILQIVKCGRWTVLECYFIVAAKVLLQEDVRLLGSKCERTSENNRKSRGRSGVPWKGSDCAKLIYSARTIFKQLHFLLECCKTVCVCTCQYTSRTCGEL